MLYVSYYRVSTDKQGRSGLGLQAQHEAVARFIGSAGTVITEFVEVESGKNCERPQLAGALAACRKHGAKLLIAKLDRLARDVHFVSGLMKSDVKFIAADMPTADVFRLHIEAAIAEEEARKISLRTRAALAAAKARGVTLGGFRGHIPTQEQRTRGHATRSATARQFAANIVHFIEEARAAGAVSLREIAMALNAKGVTTVRGGSWSAVQVSRVLAVGV